MLAGLAKWAPLVAYLGCEIGMQSFLFKGYHGFVPKESARQTSNSEPFAKDTCISRKNKTFMHTDMKGGAKVHVGDRPGSEAAHLH